MKDLIKIAAVLIISTASYALSAPMLKFGGDIQYRLRGEVNYSVDSVGNYYENSKYSEFSNKYAWNFKIAAKLNDNLSVKFRFSNPRGPGLETVNLNGKFGDLDNRQIVTIPQAEIQYSYGLFAFSAGIIEVKSNTVLSLVRSAEDGGYRKNINISNSWKTWANSSQTGLKMSFTPNNFFDINIVSAVAEYGKTDKEAETAHYVDLRTIVDIPFSFGEKGQFKVIPTVAIRSGMSGEYENRYYNTNGGIDFSGKFTKLFSLKAGAAYGMYRDPSEEWEKPSGLLLMVKPTVKFGINKLTLGYSFGQSKDLNAEGEKDYSMLFQHFDIKWGLGLAKGFTVMPRFRMWYTSDTMNDSDSSIRLRPELIFSAKF